MRRKIPSGSVFQKTYLDRSGRTRKTSTWYMKYYVRGKPVEVSCGTTDYSEALTMLRTRMAERAIHPDYGAEPERVRMDQLFDLLLEDHRFKQRKSTGDVEKRIDLHLRPFFGERKAQAISTSLQHEYVNRRLRQKSKAAPINKELSWVRRALKLGAKHEPPLVLRVPHFEMLPVDNVREGTIEHEQYRAVRDALPAYARIALVIAYHTGARKGEIRSIQRVQIDLKVKRILLPARTTKNGKPRYLPIYGDMEGELDMAIDGGDRTCPLLVQHQGKPVFDFEKAWTTACALAGVPHALFHDLRRTALTNMIEAGLSEKEAMEISGHKTRAVFDRYHIVSERRMRQYGEKLGAHLKAKEGTSPNVANPETVQDNGARQSERPH